MGENLSVSGENSNKLTYSVLLEPLEKGGFLATVLGWPQCQAVGKSREEAIARLRELVAARLEKAEVVSMEVERPEKEHPWMKFAGMFKDDPYFDEMMADIEAFRRERDAEMEAYYQEMDAMEEVKAK
ncbi:MAG: type II toxin-antitoxin system HicB family antitoxin [Okeania sp. SIO2H7]|nr:type II toxin-antitoxin system HicB family antitoxin [Okeania sp. SIO2H7]